MEAVVNWFQDWSDACEYAKECAPDLSFLALREPWSAFAAIALMVLAVWLSNERGLRKVLAKERRARATIQPAGSLAPVLDQMKSPLSAAASRPRAA